jgi:uncharacterized membrane protein YcaP (DUF421 family)
MKGLRKASLISKNELNEELRVKGFTSSSEVQQGFIVPNGEISLFAKSNQKQSKDKK